MLTVNGCIYRTVMAKACFYEGHLVSITIFMNGGFFEGNVSWIHFAPLWYFQTV